MNLTADLIPQNSSLKYIPKEERNLASLNESVNDDIT